MPRLKTSQRFTTALEQANLQVQQKLEDFIENGPIKSRPSKTKSPRASAFEAVTLANRSYSEDASLPWKPARQCWMEGKELDNLTDERWVPNTSSSHLKLAEAADYVSTYKGYNGVLRPEYEMIEPWAMYDTEVFIKQAIGRRVSLAFRAGYEIIGERQEDIDYIHRRMQTMEFVMTHGNQLVTFNGFLRSMYHNWLLVHNVFLQKIRDTKGSGGAKKDGGKIPVAGYVFIPAHTIVPYLKHGKIDHWRRYFDTGQPFEEIQPDDLIHLVKDRKPGHIFAAPSTVGLRDDVFALRRLEENIELLFINHLFPLFHVAIGSDDIPCGIKDGHSEIDIVKYQIENMPKEGVFVTDNRTEVDVVGAQGESLDPKYFLAHYKSRVFAGLGVSGVDMGEGDTSNRSTSDTVSQNLKDSVKSDLDEFCELLRLAFFKEWFAEAPYSTSLQRATAETTLQFHEIDLDSRIKEETHVTNLYNSSLITETEGRKRLKYQPMTAEQRKDTHYWLHIRDLALVTAKAKAKESGVATKASPTKKGTATKSQPTNQHGTNPGPTKAKSARETFLSSLLDRLFIERDFMFSEGLTSLAAWQKRSRSVIDEVLNQVTLEFGDNEFAKAYTNQVWMGKQRLYDLVGQSTDRDILRILLDDGLSGEEEPNAGTSQMEYDSPDAPGSSDGERQNDGRNGSDAPQPGDGGPDPVAEDPQLSPPVLAAAA